MALHGYGTTATGLASAHEINPHANANDYIVVYPQVLGFTQRSPGRVVMIWSAHGTIWRAMPTEAAPTVCPIVSITLLSRVR